MNVWLVALAVVLARLAIMLAVSWRDDDRRLGDLEREIDDILDRLGWAR